MLAKNEVIIKVLEFVENIKNHTTEKVNQDLLLVEEARKEWKSAREYFNTVTDPDLIDHAIYALEAAERRYVYLLKKIREEKVFQEKFETHRHAL